MIDSKVFFLDRDFPNRANNSFVNFVFHLVIISTVRSVRSSDILIARFSDGTDRDVTDRSVFISNNDAAASVTEDGDVERWVGSSKKKLLEDKEETIKYLQSLKK